jgi:Uma2 family endonuclease
LHEDPPPDLVIEVDITSPSLNKLPLYAAIGVQEVWRYDGRQLTIFVLDDGEYNERTESSALPQIPGAQIFRFIKERQEVKQSAWFRRVRDWAQQQKA